jgi:aminoglycoside phosphotransferase (APT) family kinase protein
MLVSKNEQKFAQLLQKFEPQSQLVRAWELKGGVSAQVTALEIEQADGQTQKVVVRQHGEVDRQNNPNIAADEFKLLDSLHAAGLPVPKPYYFALSDEILSTPYIVIEYIEGETEFAPPDLADFIGQFATNLANLHRLDLAKLDLAFLPEQPKIAIERIKNRPAKLDESLEEGRIRDALEAVFPLPQRNKTVLLHGDFWPGNLLWKNNKLVAIIDWEDAQLGDPVAEVANARLELLWAVGIEAMENFTRQYKVINPLDFTDLAYWDLYAALRPMFKIGEWAGDEVAEKTMREKHRRFVAQAFARLLSKQS